MREFLAKLQTRFDGKIDEDNSELLGMQWERNLDDRTSKIHQAAFTEKMLKSFGFWQYHKPPRTPMLPGTRLIPEPTLATVGPDLHRRNRACVGALGWLAQVTRPDIAQTYSELSKHVSRPSTSRMYIRIASPRGREKIAHPMAGIL